VRRAVIATNVRADFDMWGFLFPAIRPVR